MTTETGLDVTAELAGLQHTYELDAAFAHLRAPGVQYVSGAGSTAPQLILIGEAPGHTENLSGQPFMGRSGQLLNQLLGEIWLRRDQQWITNVVKYRPEDNRTPDDAEIAASRPYLRRELALFGVDRLPPPVVLLGRTALTMVLPGCAVSNMRGNIIERGRWLYVPTYHPAAALRNPLLTRKMRDDFSVVRRLLTHVNRRQALAERA